MSGHEWTMSRFKMVLLLPFILMLYCWNVYWVVSANNVCPAECTCRWKGGKETVECIKRELSSVPVNIDSGTQVLDLMDNNLQDLPRDTFLRAKLLNLQRIYLSNCNVGQIHEGAFNRLTNLVELDLSNNLLVSIPVAALKDISGLRRLALNNNPVQRVENNAFVSLTALTTLELSRCQIELVAPKAFNGLKELRYLKLDNNRLTSLSGKSIQPLQKLHGVDLHANPWRCDCSMQDVKIWLTRNNIPYQVPPTCTQPPRLRGLTLENLDLDDLACQPQSMYSNRRIEVTVGHNASLVCEVTSNPEPQIQWLRFGQPLVNLTRFGQSKQVYVIYERGNTEKASILTITSVTEHDSGDYVCIAKNKAGEFTANFTLQVTFRDLEASGLSSGQIAGISLGLILVGVIVSLLICILLAKWRQSSRTDVKHPPLNQSQHKLINSMNHVDHYKGGQNSTANKIGGGSGNNSVRMSFSLPRLSRSNSTQRNYSDEASDSDRTLIENLTSPSKSSTCNLSNKPDVVNVERAADHRSSSAGKKDKESRKKEKRQEKKLQKEKRRERHHRTNDDATSHPNKNEPPSSSAPPQQQFEKSGSFEKCNSVQQTLHSPNQEHHHHSSDNKKVTEDDNRYGSLGSLKLSSSNEWNKVTQETIENAGFIRDYDEALVGGGAPPPSAPLESYELIEKTWGRGCSEYNKLSGGDGGENKMVGNSVGSPVAPVLPDTLKSNCISTTTLPKNSSSNNTRFRHYVPVLPPLPAQHYSQVRNSLIRTGKKIGSSSEDITDM